MINRTAAFSLLAGVLAGYFLAGSTVKAQNPPAGFAPSFVMAGEDLTIQFPRGVLSENVSSLSCRVVRTDTSWVKCASTDSMALDRPDRWVNLAYALQTTRREK
jgi:hypothetical protein